MLSNITTSTVKTKVETHLKMQAEETLKALGLDMAAALRMFLRQIVLKGAIPFEVSLPKLSPETLAAVADSYAGRVRKADSVDALFDSPDD